MKRLTSLAMIVLITITSIVPVFAAPTVPGAVYSDQQATGSNKPVVQIQQELQQAGIKDVKPTDWFAGSITVVVQAGLLAPKEDGQFHPEAVLSTSEGVAVFAKVLGIASKTDTPEQALAKSKEAGLIGANASPVTNLTRIETARLLGKALGVEVKPILSQSDYPFKDFDLLSPEDRGILKALYDLGIFRGYADHTFRPNDVLDRATIALLVDRILGAHK